MPRSPTRSIIPRESAKALPTRSLFKVAPGAVIRREVAEQLGRLGALQATLEAALDEAYVEGQRRGLLEVLEQCAGALRGAEEVARQRLEARAGDIMTLALAVAERILQDTVDASPERWRRLIFEALETFPSHGAVSIQAGDAALELLERMRDEIEGRFGQRVALEGRGDGAARWDLRISVGGASLDMGLEKQLEAIATAWGVER